MKFTIVLLAIVGLTYGATIPADEVKDSAKQKFLFEIVYRIEDPLMFEEYIKLGKSFVYHPDDYFNNELYAEEMQNYYKAYTAGVSLPKGEFFGALIPSHHRQLIGLFGFLYYSKNWEIFQRNVCWARLHANEGMFVQALTMAIIHRDDFQGLMLPTIYEIFPQHFFNSKFVYEAEKFDYDVWSKYIMYEKEYKDVMYTDYTKYLKADNKHLYTKDWKLWQWWKLMGLGEHWYSQDRFMLSYPDLPDSVNDVKIFWMPVDYTRDIKFYNQESALSYFVEDLDWNSYWYYLNMGYAPFLDGKTFGLDKDRRGDYWYFKVRQLLARYYMERLSHGYGEIPYLNQFMPVEHGYHPQLIHYNGVGFSSRNNYYDIKIYADLDIYNKITKFRDSVATMITRGQYTMSDGQTIDLRKPESIEFLGNVMQGNNDVYDKYFTTYWQQMAHLYYGDVDHDSYNYPHVLLNYETMLRDPLFYMMYKNFAQDFFQFYKYIEPYTADELKFPGIAIKNVEASDLTTYFDLFDSDVTNLLNDKMTFVDGEFVWDKTLLARQMRLNHKPFKFTFTVESDKEQKVVIRTFLAPKYDEFGRVLSLSENRENFYEIERFLYQLKAGANTFDRSSMQSCVNVPDRSMYSRRYYKLLTNPTDTQEDIWDAALGYCGFPDRLVLPRGWLQGMPMQLFFIVTPYKDESGHDDYHDTCHIGSGIRHIDELPFGYPFDREINEYEFFVPNMYMMDVKIYHEDMLDKYFGEQYAAKFGTFDIDYYEAMDKEYQKCNINK